jgi:hypothetical protein
MLAHPKTPAKLDACGVPGSMDSLTRGYMKANVIFLTIALVAVTISQSVAQVYSQNAVGYVNTTVLGGGKQAILVNPLNGTNNNVNTIMPLPNNAGYAGCSVFRYDSASSSFKDPLEWFDDFGWFSASEDNPAINPGEAFFFRNASASVLNLTLVGEVPQGSLSIDVPGHNKLAFRGSQVPQAAPLGDTTLNATNTLQFPADPGDAIFFWDSENGRPDRILR